MSDKKINMIQTIGPNFGTDPCAPADNKSAESIVKVVVSSLIRGFREDTLPGHAIKTASEALMEIGADLGKHLRIPEEVPEDARTLLGLQWIGQLAQAAWAGMLTDDPVIAVVVNEVWNQAHTDMNVAILDESQTERYCALMTDDFAIDLVGEVTEAVANFNITGCVCGKPHDAADTATDDLSAASLLAGMDPNTLDTLAMIHAATGETPESLVETLRDVYLAGGSKGAGTAALLAKALGKVAAAKVDPEPEVHLGVVELKGGSTEDQLVEKLYTELVQAQGKDWNDFTRAKLRAAIRKNLPAIMAGGPVKIEIDLT